MMQAELSDPFFEEHFDVIEFSSEESLYQAEMNMEGF